MDAHGQDEVDWGMLKRIIALLLSLADLAERSSRRSVAVRRLVLWLLYPAEVVARKLVLDAYGPAALPAARAAFTEDSTEDALRLAACLRMLAVMLGSIVAGMIALPCGASAFQGPEASSGRAPERVGGIAFASMSGPCPDTS